MDTYIKYVPKPFLDDLVSNQCIPVIGAGFSKNAVLPKEKNMPLWEDLGKEIGNLIPDYQFHSPIDALSAYCQEYGRSKL